MSLTIELPPDIEVTLRESRADLEQVAREAVLVELYKRRQLTHHQFAVALGIDRFTADGVLKRHGVMLELTPEELAGEIADLRELLSGR